MLAIVYLSCSAKPPLGPVYLKQGPLVTSRPSCLPEVRACTTPKPRIPNPNSRLRVLNRATFQRQGLYHMTSHLFFDLSGLHFLRYHLQHQDLRPKRVKKALASFSLRTPVRALRPRIGSLPIIPKIKGKGQRPEIKGKGQRPGQRGAAAVAALGWDGAFHRPFRGKGRGVRSMAIPKRTRRKEPRAALISLMRIRELLTPLSHH